MDYKSVVATLCKALRSFFLSFFFFFFFIKQIQHIDNLMKCSYQILLTSVLLLLSRKNTLHSFFLEILG